MSKQQTAVEWLVKIYLQKGKIDSFDINQSKAMEKEQIKTAWCDGNDSEPKEITGDYAEQYFNKTYGGDK